LSKLYTTIDGSCCFVFWLFFGTHNKFLLKRFSEKILFGLFMTFSSVLLSAPSTAFFYGYPMPVHLLAHYEQVIVEPDNLGDPKYLMSKGVKVFAYVSIGEVDPVRSSEQNIPESWLLGKNEGWGSKIADLTSEGWVDHLLKKRFSALWGKGYRGFFLDTLDSYQNVARNQEERTAQRLALVNIIKQIHQQFPGIKLIFNRGFEILPDVAIYADGIVAESLFQSWNPSTKRYERVSVSDREWLTEKLREARDQYQLPVIVVDYVPSNRKQLARQTAKMISQLGFTPWVAVPSLDTLGVGEVEIYPRRILALYDSNDHPTGYETSEIHRLLAMPLEYLGYTLEYKNIQEGLPNYQIAGRYAGVISWFKTGSIRNESLYRDWLLQQIAEGIKIAIFDHLGFLPDPEFLKKLGVERIEKQVNKPLKIKQADELINFEIKAFPGLRGLTRWRINNNKIKQHLSLVDADDHEFDAVFTAPWGGIAFQPYIFMTGYQDRQRWIIDPFLFLQKALNLPEIPTPDITTENGRRFLMAQIDGDGVSSLAELPETPIAAEVIYKSILRRFPIPTTVSVIEGEITAKQNKPDQRIAIENSLRNIFKLENVEIASHSFSHPLSWFSKGNINSSGDDYSIQLDGYHFDLDREITGSVSYINQHLAPKGKQVQVFVWTGDGLPGLEAIEKTDALGLENINGGGASILNDDQTLTLIPPMGRSVGDKFQTYAPIASDQVYTHYWSFPFFGFKRVIETFQLTDLPRRLKPVHIHYHFYSGTKASALDALKEVHQWAVNEETFPIWISDFTKKVKEFQKLSLAKRLDGGWDIRGAEKLRTLRLSPQSGWPNFQKSVGVIGVRDAPQGRYVSLMPKQKKVLLYLQDVKPDTPYLVQANGVVKQWQVTPQGISFQIRSHGQVEMVVANVKQHCHVSWNGTKITGQPQKEGWRFRFPKIDTGEAVLVCNVDA